MGKLPITVLVQTKNEEVGIRSCLESLSSFDEVIVVDSNSTDGTQELAEGFGVRVETFTWNGHYPKKKQWQLDHLQTRHEWILFLDADEKPSDTMVKELYELFADGSPGDFAAFDVELDYVFNGKLLRHGHRVVKRVLLKRTHAQFPEVPDLPAEGMGELEGHYQPRVRGRIGRLRAHLLHADEDPVRTWFDRHNRYSDWESYLRENPRTKAEVARLRSRQGRIFAAVPGKPAAFFVYAYLARGGFLDGRAGFDYAMALSFYYWQVSLKTRERRRLREQEQAATSHKHPAIGPNS